MLTNAQKLQIVKDLIDAGNPAFGINYDCSLKINLQNTDGSVDISLINDEQEVDSGATVHVLDEGFRGATMLEVDLADEGSTRLINAIPHTLFAILYC